MRQTIAQLLLDTQAIFLSVEQPFTWASGIQSPIYCDNRKVLAFPKERRIVKEAFVDLLKSLEFDGIMGTATAGIPMASILADALDVPLGYIRSSKKSHGRTNQIEGFHQKGAKVIVIEDLISTGGSVLTAVEAARESGMEVVAVCAIFSYNLPQVGTTFEQANVPLYTLSDFDCLIELAHTAQTITSEQVAQLKQFQSNPRDNRWIR